MSMSSFKLKRANKSKVIYFFDKEAAKKSLLNGSSLDEQFKALEISSEAECQEMKLELERFKQER